MLWDNLWEPFLHYLEKEENKVLLSSVVFFFI